MTRKRTAASSATVGYLVNNRHKVIPVRAYTTANLRHRRGLNLKGGCAKMNERRMNIATRGRAKEGTRFPEVHWLAEDPDRRRPLRDRPDTLQNTYVINFTTASLPAWSDIDHEGLLNENARIYHSSPAAPLSMQRCSFQAEQRPASISRCSRMILSCQQHQR
jgi:hypothetical protein